MLWHGRLTESPKLTWNFYLLFWFDYSNFNIYFVPKPQPKQVHILNKLFSGVKLPRFTFIKSIFQLSVSLITKPSITLGADVPAKQTNLKMILTIRDIPSSLSQINNDQAGGKPTVNTLSINKPGGTNNNIKAVPFTASLLSQGSDPIFFCSLSSVRRWAQLKTHLILLLVRQRAIQDIHRYTDIKENRKD